MVRISYWGVVCSPPVAARLGAAPGPGDSAKAMAGNWEFTNADREKTCTITLRLEPVAGGMRAEFERPAPPSFCSSARSRPDLVENDVLRLVDAKATRSWKFNEVEKRRL